MPLTHARPARWKRSASKAGLIASLLCATAHASQEAPRTTDDAVFENVERSTFGRLPDGREVERYRITNVNGLVLSVITYGGIITALEVPDADGRLDDILLGFDTLDGYLSDTYRQVNPYFGALIGRYGNRIAGGRFSLGGENYTLATNDGDNHLHGGEQGFDRVLWEADPFDSDGGSGVVLRYTSADGEQGYPGELRVAVTYMLTDDDELVVDYQAETDQPTPVNLTQHSYFNLEGEGSGRIADHRLMLAASTFTPVDATLIPTGERRAVAGTPFDFTQPWAIGEHIYEDDEQLAFGQGYDHNFVLDRGNAGDDEPVLAARVWAPATGRVLEIETTEPGIQFYSGNFLGGELTGKRGEPYAHRSGFALETQHFPDSPNQAGFPSTILSPSEHYHSRTVMRFSTRPRAD